MKFIPARNNTDEGTAFTNSWKTLVDLKIRKINGKKYPAWKISQCTSRIREKHGFTWRVQVIMAQAEIVRT